MSKFKIGDIVRYNSPYFDIWKESYSISSVSPGVEYGGKGNTVYILKGNYSGNNQSAIERDLSLYILNPEDSRLRVKNNKLIV